MELFVWVDQIDVRLSCKQIPEQGSFSHKSIRLGGTIDPLFSSLCCRHCCCLPIIIQKKREERERERERKNIHVMHGHVIGSRRRRRMNGNIFPKRILSWIGENKQTNKQTNMKPNTEHIRSDLNKQQYYQNGMFHFDETTFTIINL